MGGGGSVARTHELAGFSCYIQKNLSERDVRAICQMKASSSFSDGNLPEMERIFSTEMNNGGWSVLI